MNMEREKQIEKYCEEQGFPMGSCSSINSVKALVAADAIRWADKHPVSHPVEIRCSKERIERIKGLYEKHYQSVAITLIEEGHSKEEIALMFFELGARAADENPIERKEDADDL